MRKYQPTPDTIEAFTCGDCWMLARAIHDISKWDMVLYNPYPHRDLDYWEHVAVRMPDGLILDIEGAHTEDDFLQRWNENAADEDAYEYGEVIPLSGVDEWERATGDQVPAYADPENAWPRARRVARRILADYGIS